MDKVIKMGLTIIFFSLIFFASNGEKVQAATADCFDLHAGFCEAAGLHYGVNTDINFNAVKALLEKHYRDHAAIFGFSYMEYRGGHWYWVCVNMDIIRFDGVAPPCNPNAWRSYGACSETCGGGVQYRYNDCGAKSPARACNTQPCCGLADKKTYKTTNEIETDTDTRCNAGDTMTNWLDNSGIAANNGKAWTWNCNDGTADSNQCLAYKSGECNDEPVAPAYSSRDESCKFGAFNSVKLVKDTDGITDILKWKCGTGELTDRHIGDFFSPDNIANGPAVGVDYYGPKLGGVECKCIPTYDYTCESTNTYTGSCDNNCGGTIEETYRAIKTDASCFLGESIFIDNTEYNTATGNHCANKSANCAPCGTQDSEGGSYHETAY